MVDFIVDPFVGGLNLLWLAVVSVSIFDVFNFALCQFANIETKRIRKVIFDSLNIIVDFVWANRTYECCRFFRLFTDKERDFHKNGVHCLIPFPAALCSGIVVRFGNVCLSQSRLAELFDWSRAVLPESVFY